MDFRFVAYNPQTGTKLYQLPRANSVQIGDTFGTRGTLELKYSTKALGARELPTFLEIQAEVTFNGGHAWAEVGPRLIRLTGEHEDTDASGMRTLRFVGREWVLEKARVGSGGGELIDGKRAFYQATPGQIIRTLLLEAQDRGAAQGIELSGFTNSKDTAGNTWSKKATIYYSPGLPIGSVLENLVEQGLCDYRLDGRTLNLYEPETTMGRDLTTGANPVRVHGAVTEAPVKYSLEDLASAALLIGDEGFELEVENPSAPDDYGRLEVTIEQGGVSDAGTARLMVDEALQRGSREIKEITRSQSAAGAAFLPYRDYRVGDYVQVLDGGNWERYRVREIQLVRDGQEWVIHTVINDRLQELLLKLAKRTSGIVNGSTGSGGDGTRPAPADKPGIEPAAPEGLVIDQQVYLDRQGIARGQITAGWGAVTESTKGQAVEIGGYELWWRRNETGAVWTRAAVTTGDLSVSHSPVVLSDTFGNAMAYQWKVRAIAQASNRPGPFSAPVTLTMTQDTEPPNVPSLPTVATDLRIITVEIDGLDEDGEAMPVDYNHTRIYFASAENMAGAERVGSLTQPGTWNSGSMAPDVPVWVAVSAVDNVGNESAMTPAQSVTPRKLVDDDSIRDAVEGIDDKINKAVENLNEAIDNIVIDDAGIATYWQPTAPNASTNPPPKEGFLWFDTSEAGGNELHRYVNGSWVSAADERIQAVQNAQEEFGQDISDAERRAEDARGALAARIDQDLADAKTDLESDINRVRTSVDGKNRTTQSTSTPPNQYDGVVNDTWEIMSSMGSGGRMVSRWRWNGTVWVSNLIGDTALGNVDASKIKAGLMSGERIDAGTLTADKLLIGDFSNLVDDPAFAGPGWSGSISYEFRYTGQGPGLALYYAGTDGGYVQNSNTFPVMPGDKFSISARIQNRRTMWVRYQVAWFQHDMTPSAVSEADGVIYDPTSASVWNDLAAEVAAPSDSRFGVLRIVFHSGGGPAYLIRPTVRRMTGATLIEDGAITTDKIAAKAVKAGHLQAGSVGAEELIAGSVNASHIVAGGIQADEILAGDSVDGTLIQGGAITTGKIAAGAITSDSGVIGDFNAGSITSGTIEAARIGAKTITSDKLLIGAVDNLLPGADDWDTSSIGWSEFGRSASTASIWIQGTQTLTSDSPFKMIPGAYVFSVEARSSVAGTRFYIQATGGDSPYILLDQAVGTSWSQFTGTFTVSTAMDTTIRVFGNHANGASNPEGYQWFRNMSLRRMTGATLIEDGAITTDKILANAITAGKIAALAIEADHIAANAITADKIKAGAIDGKLITGARIRTAASGARVELTSEGLKAYKSNGSVVLSSDTSDGSIDMTGILSQTISGVTLRVGVGWQGDFPGVQWSDSNIYNYPPGVGLKLVEGSTTKKETLLQGPGVNSGNSFLALSERGEYFDMQAWNRSGSDRTSWQVYGSMADNFMSVGNGTGRGPYLSFKRGTGDTGQAWFGYQHPTNGGFSSLALKDRSVWMGSRDSNQNLVGLFAADETGTWITSGTRRMDIFGKLLSIQSDEIYIPSHLPQDSDPWLIGRVSGRLHEKSSSRRFKLIEESIETTVESFEDKLLTIDAKTWVDRTRAERIADYHTAITNGGDPGYTLDTCGSLNRIPGLIAEDLDDAGLGIFVRYNDEGEPTSVNYDAIGPALIPIIRRLRDRVDALEQQLGATV